MNYLYAENYQALNEQLSEAVSEKYGQPLKVRAFENVMLAGYDLCFGLLQFLSHRPKVGSIRSGTSLQEYLLPHFYRLQTPILFKKENENVAQYIAQFDHEVNFVLWSSENEITGEKILSLEQRQEIHNLLSAKRIFSIEVKSKFNAEDADVIKQFGYSVVIESGSAFEDEKCLIYHSDKLKTPTLIGHYQNNLQTAQSYLSAATGQKAINTALLKEIDSFGLNYFSRFALKPATLQDRLVLCSKTVAGSALKAELNLKANEAFAPSELPSWIIEAIPAWWGEAKSVDLVMGLLIIDINAVSENTLQKITEIHDKLTKASTWSIS
ncbi:MAG: hypothetical protein V4654_03815 [Bdellovibrionota bacterium]